MKENELKNIVLNKLKEKVNHKEGEGHNKIVIELKLYTTPHGLVFIKKDSKWILLETNILEYEDAYENKKVPSFSDEQLLDVLEMFAEHSMEKREYPSSQNYRKNFKSPSYTLFLRRFGSWENGLAKTKIDLNKIEHLKHPSYIKYTDEELLISLSKFVKENPNDFRVSRYENQKYKPYSTNYYNHFGNWEDALCQLLSTDLLEENLKQKIKEYLYKRK